MGGSAVDASSVAIPPTLDEIRTGKGRQETAEIELSAAAPAELDLRGYQLIETLGKGGMGEVYRCGDPALGRDLAIKVMMAAHRGHAERERRFLREARVTGSLQHPSIVRVHNLGRLSDGRLHYTMRLVRGRTFADILKDEAGKPERLPYLLSIFEKICQAVAYAHSKRVIHRDLKPSNVMVGRFGEVQVMDWGLAKVLTADDAPVKAETTPDAAGTRIFTESADTPVDLSRTGAGFGTLPYMPSEQARGKWNMVDERADVFALGSILFEILTGQPAYIGASSHELIDRAERGDVTETLQRLQQCGADAALTTLCRECLSSHREDRPRDADAVAKRVAEHQDEVQERLRQAEVERAEAQLKAREVRKQRRLLIALVFALLAGGTLSTWQAVRATAERDDKEIALGKAEKAAEAERQANKLAQALLGQYQKATGLLASIFHDLNPSAEEKGGPSLAEQFRGRLKGAAAQLDGLAIDDPLTVAGLQNTLGESLTTLGDGPLAIELLSKSRAIRETQLGLKHLDTLTTINNLAAAYLSAGELNQALSLFEQALTTMQAEFGPDHLDALSATSNLAMAYQTAGRMDQALPLFEQVLVKFKIKQGLDHLDTLAAMNNLAHAYKITGRFDKALPLYEETLKRLKATLGADHFNTLNTTNNLGKAYLEFGQLGKALTLLEHALDKRREKLGSDHPLTLQSMNNLAQAYRLAKQLNKAVALFEQTLVKRKTKLGTDHPDTLASMSDLAGAYSDDGQRSKALPLYEQALTAAQSKLGPNHLYTLTFTINLARAYLTDGQLDKAVPLFELALTKMKNQFGPEHPRTLTTLTNMAAAYRAAGKLDREEPLMRELVQTQRKKAGSESPVAAGILAQLGTNLLRQKKYAEAELVLRECLTIRENKFPDDWLTFNTRSALGEALLGQKMYADAEPLLLQGYEEIKQCESKIPRQGKVRLTEALERLVLLYEATDQKEKAADWRKKLEETKTAQKKPKP